MRTSTSTRFNFTFFSMFSKQRHPGKLHFTFFHQKSSYGYLYWRRLSTLPIAKWWNFLDLITCSRHFNILAKTRSRITTVITFSRQKDAGSRVSNTQYWENLVPVVVLASESKAFWWLVVINSQKEHNNYMNACRLENMQMGKHLLGKMAGGR